VVHSIVLAAGILLADTVAADTTATAEADIAVIVVAEMALVLQRCYLIRGSC